MNPWKYKMRNAHRMAERLTYLNKKSYRTNLATAMKFQHMMNRVITIIDINWIYANLDVLKINLLKNVTSFHKSEMFKCKGDAYEIVIEKHITYNADVNNALLGAFIESEIKSGIKPTYD